MPPHFLALGVAIVAASTAGPLVAYAAAPALAIAFWRNAMAVAPLAPLAVATRRGELRHLLTTREGLYSLLAGVALAAHLAAWVPSSKLTSVAASTALVATQPIWSGVIAAVQGRRPAALTWAGIGVAVVGAAVATGADVGVDRRAVLGDLLALLAAVLGAVYMALGERARERASTVTYTAVCYTVAAVVLLPVCLIGGVRLGGYPASAWLAIVAITVGPQLLGHSMINYSLKRIAPTTTSVIMLLQVPGAALVAWLWLGQLPHTLAWLGIGLLLLGVVIVVLGNQRPVRAPVPVQA